MLPHDKRRLDRLENVTTGMLSQARMREKRADLRFRRLEQAILELASALRDAGIAPDGIGLSLPSPSALPVPLPPSHDVSSAP